LAGPDHVGITAPASSRVAKGTPLRATPTRHTSSSVCSWAAQGSNKGAMRRWVTRNATQSRACTSTPTAASEDPKENTMPRAWATGSR
jgi:hypothetical protein